MATTMARQEGHAAPPYLTNYHRRAGISIWGLHHHLFGVVEERVEARPPEDPDLSALPSHR